MHFPHSRLAHSTLLQRSKICFKQGAGLKLLPTSASLNIFPPRLIQYLGGAFDIKVPPFFILSMRCLP